MDEYGSFRNTKEDAKELREAMKTSQHDIVFAWSYNQIDCYIFHVSQNFDVLGIMPFGGNPRSRVYVGLYGKGCNHFSKDEIHPSYWEEKLRIDKQGAEAWAEFWTHIWSYE